MFAFASKIPLFFPSCVSRVLAELTNVACSIIAPTTKSLAESDDSIIISSSSHSKILLYSERIFSAYFQGSFIIRSCNFLLWKQKGYERMPEIPTPSTFISWIFHGCLQKSSLLSDRSVSNLTGNHERIIPCLLPDYAQKPMCRAVFR